MAGARGQTLHSQDLAAFDLLVTPRHSHASTDPARSADEAEGTGSWPRPIAVRVRFRASAPQAGEYAISPIGISCNG